MVQAQESINDSLMREAYRECVPISVSFEITLRCNLRCIHCYNFDRAQPLPKPNTINELTPDEIFSIIDQLREAGCLFLSFTGGEALVHPKLLDFIRYAHKKRFAVSVRSNGTMLTTEAVHKLVDAGASSITISLYGGTPQTCDAFTGVRGSFERAVEGARTAKQLGLDTKFSFCLVQSNAHEIARMITLADELGIPYGIDPQITARYDGSRGSLALRVDRTTLEALYHGPLHHLMPVPDNDPKRSVQCACARSVCGISALGDVYPCIGAPIPSGNLRRQSFKEIWETSPELKRIRALKLDDFPVCKPCPHRPYCRRNSGVIYTNTQNYTGPNTFGEDWTCMEAEVLHHLHEELKDAPLTTAALSNSGLKRHTFG